MIHPCRVFRFSLHSLARPPFTAGDGLILIGLIAISI